MSASEQRTHRSWRFQQSLALIFGATVICFALLGAVATSWQATERLRRGFLQEGTQIATGFAAQSTLALLSGLGENAREAADVTLGFPNVIQVIIYDQDGGVLLQQGTNAGTPPLVPAGIEPETDVLIEDFADAWHFIVPVYFRGEGEDPFASPFSVEKLTPELLGFVRVVLGKAGLHTIRRQIFVDNLLSMFTSASVLLGLLLWLSSRLTRPLGALAALMRRAEAGEQGVRAHSSGPHEIINMSRAFNTMMAQLEHRASKIKHQNELLVQEMERERQSEAERQQLLQQLQQARKMEALGRLTGGIAHDFNNILASILGYTELASANLGKMPSEKISSYLAEVDKAGKRARDLIKQMLTFSRRSSTMPKAIQPVPVIRDVLKMLQTILPSSIELETDFEEGVPGILSDSVQLHQVVMNLCINASDAMADTGTLSVQVKRRTLEGFQCASCHGKVRGDYVEILVGDTGSGIESPLFQHVFDPFFTTKEVGDGSGMGLSVVHGIVHEHGGHILLESEPGHGTVFRLLFPALSTAGDAEVAEAQTPDLTTDSGSGRIWVVDDEPAIVSYLSELLGSCGYRVAPYTDPEAAAAQFDDDPSSVDLVITDQTMPKLSGAQLATHMLNKRPDLPIVLCTGYSAHIDEVEARELGIRSFLRKPIASRDLLDRVQELLNDAEVN